MVSLYFSFDSYHEGTKVLGNLLHPHRSKQSGGGSRECPGLQLGQEMARCFCRGGLSVVLKRKGNISGEAMARGRRGGWGMATAVRGMLSCDPNKVSWVQRGGWRIRYRYRDR